MKPSPPSWCPRCLALTEDEPVCRQCGLEQATETAGRLRVVVYRLSEIDRAQHDLAAERSTLTAERMRLLDRVEGLAPAPARPFDTTPPLPSPPRAEEWRANVVRDVLLWLGAALLAIAALTFAAYAWRRLDDSGRAAMLLGATVLAGAGATWLRDRLQATAEAFAALTLAMLLVDWLALRRAGMGDALDLPAWWAIGTALVTVSAFAAGRWFASARVVMVATGAASAALVIFTATDTAPATAVGFTIAATTAVVIAPLVRRLEWRTAALLIALAAALATCAAAVAVLVGIANASGPSPALASATALIALPFGVAVIVRRPRSDTTTDALVAGATVALLAGAAIGWWDATTGLWIATATAAAALTMVVVAGFTPPSLRVRPGVVAGAGSVLLVALGASLEPIGVALAGPLEAMTGVWHFALRDAASSVLVSDASNADALAASITVLCVALAAAVVVRLETAAVAVPVLALLPLAADSNVGGALAATALPALGAVVFTGWLARRGAPSGSLASAAVAAVLAVPATGYAVATETGSVVGAGALLAATAAATWLAPTRSVARLGAAGATAVAFHAFVGASAAAAGAQASEAGIALVAAAMVVLLAATLWHSDTGDGVLAETLGWMGWMVGVALAGGDDVHLAIALTVLVTGLAGPGVRPGRRAYLVAASTAAVAATWAWLAVADVELLEAYTLPAALGALAAGEVHRRMRPSATSWLTYGSAIVIALAPSLAVGVADDGLVRPVAVAIAAASLCWAGAAFRLQAPLALGASALVVLAIDTLGPVAAELPRWSTIAVAGGLLLWLGATADKRLAQLRHARERFESLENVR